MKYKRIPKPLRHQMSEQITEAPAGAELSIEKIVFLQINRCNILMLTSPELLLQAVNGLEIILAPYIDERYQKAIKPIKEKLNAIYKKMENTGRADTQYSEDWLNNFEFEMAKRKYRALIRLSSRSGFYPEKETWEDI